MMGGDLTVNRLGFGVMPITGDRIWVSPPTVTRRRRRRVARPSSA